jgi:hypothetical protein
MSLRALVRRRPSAALVVSCLALFVALGGAGYAALRLPAHSVGNVQLQNFSVGNAKLRPNSVSAGKIAPGAVGARQVDPSQVQLRVLGPCGSGNAIQSIAAAGNPTCTPVLPNEYGVAGPGVTLGSSSANPTQVASETLAGGTGGTSYLVIGNVHVSAVDGAGAAQTVFVACSLRTPGFSPSSGDVTIPLGGSYTSTGSAMLPLILAEAVASPPSPSEPFSVACYQNPTPASPAPTVTATATINAIQTASDN